MFRAFRLRPIWKRIRMQTPKRVGFALTELLVVLTFMGILVALLPTVQAARERQCLVQKRHLLWSYLNQVHVGGGFDLHDATRRVCEGTVHSNNRRIGLTENWLQWILGECYEPLSKTQDSRRLILGGFANCSERAQILKTIAEKAGYPCRFVGLEGHVVLEVQTQRAWQVADPDYGVVFPARLVDLEGADGPQLMRRLLANSGYDEASIERYVEMVHSTNDNVVLPIGSPLSPRLYVIERCCDWLVWFLPAACLSLALFSLRRSATRHARAVGRMSLQLLGHDSYGYSVEQTSGCTRSADSCPARAVVPGISGTAAAFGRTARGRGRTGASALWVG